MTRDDRERPHDRDSDTDRPFDLSALRRTSSDRPAGPRVGGEAGDTRAFDRPDRWEALARRIELAAAPELARRARHARGAAAVGAPDLLFVIARAARPALLAVAASVVFAVAIARTIGAAGGEQSFGTVAAASADEVSVARALSVEEPAATWLVQQRAPNADDMARIVDPEVAR